MIGLKIKGKKSGKEKKPSIKKDGDGNVAMQALNHVRRLEESLFDEKEARLKGVRRFEESHFDINEALLRVEKIFARWFEELDRQIEKGGKTHARRLEELERGFEERGKWIEEAQEAQETHARQFEELNRGVEELDRRIGEAEKRPSRRARWFEELDRRLDEAEERQLEIEKQIHALELLVKKLDWHTNQVSWHVALEKARNKARSLLNKPPLATGQKWSEYFLAFSSEDWRTICGGEKDLKKVNDVKRLLCYGSIEANKDIHDLEFQDVCEGIFSQDVASSQEAWVWVASIGFSKSIEDINIAFANLGKNNDI